MSRAFTLKGKNRGREANALPLTMFVILVQARDPLCYFVITLISIGAMLSSSRLAANDKWIS